jgi:hypothetical protein
MSQLDRYTQRALDHIRYLSQTIGGRGSCTTAERSAAEYVAEQMRLLGVSDVRLEPYQGAPSTYRPYALAFSAALAGTALAWLVPGRGMMAAAALLSALGTWGMLAETDFAASWMRWLLPKAGSQNAVGIIPPQEDVRTKAVLCAHLDTHRTPIFYSSKTWHTVFGLVVGGALLSMAVGAVAYGLGALFAWAWVRWIGIAMAVIQVFVLALCLHADFTPFSPGANDDASGAGVILGLAERLSDEPLAHTEVWLALTGCEEVSSYGMVALLDAHAGRLGRNATYLILDQVGVGRLAFLTVDGLIFKRKTHPRALALARRASVAVSNPGVAEHVGIAYTDATVATKHGLVALTVDGAFPPDAPDVSHWHQMSDTLESLDARTLADAHAFAWQILQEIDRGE